MDDGVITEFGDWQVVESALTDGSFVYAVRGTDSLLADAPKPHDQQVVLHCRSRISAEFLAHALDMHIDSVCIAPVGTGCV